MSVHVFCMTSPLLPLLIFSLPEAPAPLQPRISFITRPSPLSPHYPLSPLQPTRPLRPSSTYPLSPHYPFSPLQPTRPLRPIRLLQLCNFPPLRPYFSPKPLACLPFTLPDRSILSVGGSSHITGELSLPNYGS